MKKLNNLSARVLALVAIGLGGIILAACASSSNDVSGVLATPSPTALSEADIVATVIAEAFATPTATEVSAGSIVASVFATLEAGKPTVTRTPMPASTPTARPTETSTPTAITAPAPAEAAIPPRAQDLGICINPWIDGHAPSLEELSELGVGWVRFVAYEAELPRLSDVLARYKGAGLRTILVVNQETFPQKEESPWLYVERFSGLFGELVQTHSRLVDAWEIWNEPEDKLRWKHLSEETYIHLLELCFSKAKRVDPETTILATGYLDFLRLKGVPRDGGAFHPYGQKVNGFPPNYVGYYESLRVPFLHADVPLWLTEYGASLESLQGLGMEPEEAQAEYLKRMVREVRKLGPEVVKVAVWFSWTDLDNHEEKKLYGLVDKDGNRRKAYYALAKLARE